MIEVIRAGLLTTVQDLGRQGYRQLGVGQGGALDSVALTVGNRLVGNEANTAGLEITVGVGSTICFSSKHLDCAHRRGC